MQSFLKFLLFLLILTLGLAGLAFYWTIVKPQPRYNAEITVPGVSANVTIYWDNYGVPHIFAASEEDLFFAQGYVHAQDRLWQMTLSQMLVDGTFAKNLGADAIEIDRYALTMGFGRTSAQIVAQSDPHMLSVMEAYARGVNTYIETNQNRLPVEFALTGIKPSPWSPVHSIGISRIMGWQLNVSWWTKVMLGYLETVLPPGDLAELYPQWPASAPRTLDPDETRRLFGNLIPLIETERGIRSMFEQNGSMVGSNAWVVDASRSATGYPLLAGDPHLGLNMPGFWYEVHLNLNGKNVSGAGIAGTPGVILGQNDFAAWSFTSTMADNTDFFRIKLNPDDRGQYLADSINGLPVYKPIQFLRMLIPTKEGDEIAHEVRLTEFGPIINDIYPNKALVEHEVIAMRWSGQDHSDELKAIYGINQAATFEAFQDAIHSFGVVGLNMMYADITGNIAMFTVGKLPVRNEPLRLRNSWDPNDHWKGYIPRANLPKIINPEKGYIANANNPVISVDYPYYISAFWEPESRIKRIEERLNETLTFTAADFMDIQNDALSVHARDLMPVVLKAIRSAGDPRFDVVIDYFENWDFMYTVNATAASLFDTFFLLLVENTFKDGIGEAAYRNFIELENMPVRVTSRMLLEGSVWFQRFHADESFARDSLIVVSMKQTVDTLTRQFGPEPSEWRWENLHTLTLHPPLFKEAAADSSASGILKMIVRNVLSKGPYGVPGHGMTVNNAQYNWAHPFSQVLGPSIRRVVDLSDLRRSFSVLPTGQSGNPLSKHFGDQTSLWLNGEYRTLEHNNRIPESREFDTMVLKPRN